MSGTRTARLGVLGLGGVRTTGDAVGMTSPSTKRRRALILSPHPIRTWNAPSNNTQRPGRSPFGVHALTDSGFDLDEVPLARSRLASKVRDTVEHRLGFELERPLRATPKVRRADVVISLLEQYAHLPLDLKRLGVPPYGGTPLVVMSCWLGETLSTMPAEERSAWVKRLRSADLVFYFSPNQRETFAHIGLSERQLLYVPFGVEAGFYTPDDSIARDLDLVSIGQDSGRDYQTLFDAVRGQPMRLNLVCHPRNLAGLDVPANVEVSEPVTHAEYRDLLRRARVVAIPTHDLAYPTGQSVALEGLLCGASVIITGTAAMRTQFTDEHVRFAPTHSPEGWRAALTAAFADPTETQARARAGRSYVLTHHQSHQMWTTVAEEMRRRIPSLA